MRPIYDALSAHLKKNMSSFHMPGHKGVPVSKEFCGIMPFDVTEIPDTDSLFEASGAIMQSEQMAANIYGAKKTLYSAGGCTLCIQTMIALCCKPNSKIICGRTIHHSVANTIALLDLTPVWVMPRQDAGDGLSGRVHPEDIKKALQNNPDSSAVYITSPDYFGVISDIEGISEVCRQFDVPLLVDNAHGTHLRFIDGGRLHPLKFATMTADSAHKTLSVLTGGALLHINDQRYINNAKEIMKLFGSTSPSYPIMLSLEAGIIAAKELDYAKLIDRVQDIKNVAEQVGFKLPYGTVDPTRITLDCYSVGYTGETIAEDMRKQGIEPELATNSHVVLIATPQNSVEDFERLHSFIGLVKPKKPIKYSKAEIKLPSTAIRMRQAVFSPCKTVKTEQAVGMISGASTVPCPPCIPIVMPGEVIDSETAERLIEFGVDEVRVVEFK